MLLQSSSSIDAPLLPLLTEFVSNQSRIAADGGVGESTVGVGMTCLSLLASLATVRDSVTSVLSAGLKNAVPGEKPLIVTTAEHTTAAAVVYQSSLTSSSGLSLGDGITGLNLSIGSGLPTNTGGTTTQHERTYGLSLFQSTTTAGYSMTTSGSAVLAMGGTTTCTVQDENATTVPVHSGSGSMANLTLPCPSCVSKRCGPRKIRL